MKIYKNWYLQLLILIFIDFWYETIICVVDKNWFINDGFSLIGHARYYWAVIEQYTVYMHTFATLVTGRRDNTCIYVTYYTNIHLAYHTFPNKNLLKHTTDFFPWIYRRLAEKIVNYEEITKVRIDKMLYRVPHHWLLLRKGCLKYPPPPTPVFAMLFRSFMVLPVFQVVQGFFKWQCRWLLCLEQIMFCFVFLFFWK